MQILRTILTVIFAIDCIALTVVVLMQEGKQQGLGGAISGAADSYWGKNKGRSMERSVVWLIPTGDRIKDAPWKEHL